DEPACEIHGAGRDLHEGAVYAIFFAEAAAPRPLCYHLDRVSPADRPCMDSRRARRMRRQRLGLIAMSTEPTVHDPPSSSPQASSETVMTTREAFLRVFPGVMVAMFLAAADQTILASALPTIASSLGGLADVSWVVVAYLLAATIAAPLYGHLGDRFGRRLMLLAALAVFTLASLACALAPTLLLLIAARAVQGLGGGGLMTLAQSLIGESVPPRERGRFGGYFAAVFAL